MSGFSFYKMKLFLPQNIFSEFVTPLLPKGIDIVRRPSSLVTKELEFTTYGVALIPSLDLVKHKTLFVSGKIGISLDGLLSNSYFYFVEGERNLEKIFVRGDVSINELLLTKILFQERYSSAVELILDTSPVMERGKDNLMCGNENFTLDLCYTGISFADELADMLDLPYVNYVFASQDKDALINFEKMSVIEDSEKLQVALENKINETSFTQNTKEFIKDNLSSLYLDITTYEQDALNELIKLIYYHGIIDDLFDIKFI